MKIILSLLLVSFLQLTGFSQANFIQSIDFDSQQRTVFGYTGPYNYSYVERYKDGTLESWNLTQIFNLNFFHISTAVDQFDNIYAYMQNTLYKYDNNSWSEYVIPSAPTSYIKFSDLSINNNFLWLTTWSGGIYHDIGVFKLELSNMNWQLFNSSNSNFPSSAIVGKIFHNGDSTWIGTNKGLILVYNDIVSIALDTISSTLPTQKIYCYYKDSDEGRWLGTMDYGLAKWINDSTFQSYNTNNSELPDNFINAIDEDSEGNLWLATDGGLACFKNNVIYSYDYLTDNYGIVTLAVDEQDRIWLGVFATGELLVFDGENLISITSIENEIANPLNFLLSQNYPNPFNPSTKIKFTISELRFATLKVYDALGNEMATLVDEEKPAGNYEVEFDGSELSSGVYFYKLRAGSFVESKKMILIR